MASIAKKFQNETKNLVETDTENESEDEAILVSNYQILMIAIQSKNALYFALVASV